MRGENRNVEKKHTKMDKYPQKLFLTCNTLIQKQGTTYIHQRGIYMYAHTSYSIYVKHLNKNQYHIFCAKYEITL